MVRFEKSSESTSKKIDPAVFRTYEDTANSFLTTLCRVVPDRFLSTLVEGFRLVFPRWVERLE